MKSKKIQFLLAALLIVALALPAVGEYESRRQERETEDVEDHPWGGDVYDPGEGPDSRRLAPANDYNSFYFMINMIRIFVFPGMEPFNPDAGSLDDGVLPNDFGENNNGNNQKGR